VQVKLFPSKITTPMIPFTTQNTSSRRWLQSGVLKSDSFCGCNVSPGVDRTFFGAKVDGEGKTEKFIMGLQEYQQTATELSNPSLATTSFFNGLRLSLRSQFTIIFSNNVFRLSIA